MGVTWPRNLGKIPNSKITAYLTCRLTNERKKVQVFLEKLVEMEVYHLKKLLEETT